MVSSTKCLLSHLTSNGEIRMSAEKPYSIHSEEEDHRDAIEQLQGRLESTVAKDLSGHDCLRFLRACNGDVSKAQQKVAAYVEWFHKPMEALSELNGLHFSPNILIYTPEHLGNHPEQGLLPVSHSGFDRKGRPLYWEKTGSIQANYSVVKKVFSKEELLQFHIFSMIGLEMRYAFSSSKCGQNVESAIYISDMANVQVSLDTDSIWYMKQLIATDQAYFPERLYRMIVINSPWYFPALYNLFKPFIDPRTREKIIILGNNYQSTLAEYIDLSQIPADFGGEDANVVWGSSSFSKESGLSLTQIEEKATEQLEKRSINLTPQEMNCLYYCFTHPRYKDESVMKRRLKFLVDWMRDLNLELPSDEPIVENLAPAAKDSDEEQANTMISASSIQSAIKNQEKLFSMPQLQVCDVLTTKIVGIENRTDHHVYIISVKFKNICSWEVKRRYSEFYAFMTKLKKVVPALNKDKYSMPPKVIFNKMAEKVVAHRSPALDLFLKATIENCKSYGTAEQDVIFSFLDAYDNIICHVCSTANERDELVRAGMASVENSACNSTEKVKVSASESDKNWQTSFAAAVITAWVIMLSLGVENFV